MKKLTILSVESFLARKPRYRHGENTKVLLSNKGDAILTLFGNPIAVNMRDGRLFITDAGWRTRTTSERLNGLPGVQIRQNRGNYLLNGQLWEGSWTLIISIPPVLIIHKETPPLDIKKILESYSKK
jgi:hypothetical protein